ncbi:hypothetical protein E3N88_20110 [Mikania micrantha]|uniref:Uncharacterized protein n=1 Tax=Mikania micrantha TaxID=192012 RepID=A0A5N6NIH5_9ASTR|nr:hypothetical protein E3N88_20110 [Mikania micrantha]
MLYFEDLDVVHNNSSSNSVLFIDLTQYFQIRSTHDSESETASEVNPPTIVLDEDEVFKGKFEYDEDDPNYSTEASIIGIEYYEGEVNIDLIDNGVVYQKDEWVDQRSYDTFGIYKGYLVEKYGEDDSQHPHFDEPLWSRTQSTSCDSSSCRHERQDSEIQRLNKIIEELVKEKESEKAKKEKEKAKKEAMLERMASIESLLRVVTKNLPSSS